MKKQMKKLELSKETLRILEAVRLAEGGGGETVTAPADTITYWPEQCTGGSCIPRNC